MSKFKIVVTAIFAISFVIGIIIFAMYRSSSQSASNVVVWGTISNEAFDAAYKNSSLAKNKLINTTYVKKSPADFDSQFIEALADGVGPDVLILRDDNIYKNRNKILVIPYKSYSARDFKTRFIEGGEIFLGTDGVLALPFIVDPLVMYWNRDMFSNSLISQTPVYWDEMYDLSKKMTVKDSSANIMQSSLSFGEWKNVNNAKEIISLLMLQAGPPITTTNGTSYYSVIDNPLDYPVAPGVSALNYYTQFSNPTATSYSWNRSLPTSLNFFLSGNLAMYFGFASEIFSIQQKNPNLNFDVANVPQIRESKKKINYGHFYGLAISKQSKVAPAAFSVINALTEPTSIQSLEGVTNLPPVRRDLISGKPTDAFRATFYTSALIAHSWIDPDSAATTDIFRNMIESITSGQIRVIGSLTEASQNINALFEKK